MMEAVIKKNTAESRQSRAVADFNGCSVIYSRTSCNSKVIEYCFITTFYPNMFIR